MRTNTLKLDIDPAPCKIMRNAESCTAVFSVPGIGTLPRSGRPFTARRS